MTAPLFLGARELSRIEREMAEVRLPEFLLSMVLVLDGIIIPGLEFAWSLMGVAGLIFVGTVRRSRFRVGSVSALVWLLSATFTFVVFVSILSPSPTGGGDWTRRITRISAIILLTVFMGAGRLHLSSMLKGITFGLFANAALFYLGIAPDNYGGALTGYLLDKNKAGLFYAVVGVLSVVQARWMPWRIVTAILFAAFVWLTESRTSITAYSFGLAWVWFVARREQAVRWGAAAFMLWFAPFLESNFAQAGQFASRWGSDLLRERIDAASAAKLAMSPWQGLGLGQAWVGIDRNKWFFHNAYWTLLVEGGWVYLIGVMIFTVFVGLRPFRRGEERPFARVGQGATVAVLVCAWKLGEVFLTIPWMLAVGTALYALLADRVHLYPMPAHPDGNLHRTVVADIDNP